MKLSEARARKLLTVRALAKAAGMSESNLHHLERGDWLPSLKAVRALSDVLEVDPMEIEEFTAAIDKASHKKGAAKD